MSTATPPPPLGERWKTWGESLNKWLASTRDKLSNFKTGDSAYQDGVLMWDRSGYPVVSYNGAWQPISFGHGKKPYGAFYDTTTQTATSSNAEEGVIWGNTAYSNLISINSSDSTKIDFEVSGTYYIMFSATIHCTNSSAKDIYFYPRLDGTDITGSTMIETLDVNDHKRTISRSGVFEIDSGSYLQAMWAVSNTDLTLQGESASAFAPAVPSVTMTIHEITTS